VSRPGTVTTPVRRVIAASGAVVVATAVTLTLSGTSWASTPRFQGWVAGVGSGRGHDFVVGDGLYLVFRDNRRATTHYGVCWGRKGHPATHCWYRTTGAVGQKSRIFTAAPQRIGTFTARWRVHSHRVATWWFYNGHGD
jgi:hypothetical protein